MHFYINTDRRRSQVRAKLKIVIVLSCAFLVLLHSCPFAFDDIIYTIFFVLDLTLKMKEDESSLFLVKQENNNKDDSAIKKKIL